MTTTEDPKFTKKKLSFLIETPEEGELFLRGLMIAQANNSSPIFPQLIEGVNSVLEEYRAAKVLLDIAVRDKAMESWGR
jgi:hypothetical protein